MDAAPQVGIEPRWQACADTLRDHFHHNANHKCLLWVNPAHEDPFGSIAFIQARRVQVNINHPRFDSKLGPYLVPLRLSEHEDDDIFRASVEMAWTAWSSESLCARAGQPIAGWIDTADDPRSLAHYWASRCHLHRFDGQSWLLRFHDPGVREWLWEILTQDQQRKLLGSARALFGLNRAQQLMQHRLASSPSGKSPENQSLLLDKRQWTDVGNYATAHGAWLQWIGLTPALRTPLAEHWQREVLDALSHAPAYGIDNESDRQLFALHALMIGADFHRSPKLAPVWQKTLAGEFYGGALEDVFEGPANQLRAHL